MTLSLAIALNAALVVALLGGLAWFMSPPRKLTPHVSTGYGFTAGWIAVVGDVESERPVRDAHPATL